MIFRGGELVRTAICKEMPKSFDILVMVVFPEEIAHELCLVANGRASVTSEVHLAVISWNTAFLKVRVKCRNTPGKGAIL